MADHELHSSKERRGRRAAPATAPRARLRTNEHLHGTNVFILDVTNTTIYPHYRTPAPLTRSILLFATCNAVVAVRCFLHIPPTNASLSSSSSSPFAFLESRTLNVIYHVYAHRFTNSNVAQQLFVWPAPGNSFGPAISAAAAHVFALLSAPPSYPTGYLLHLLLHVLFPRRAVATASAPVSLPVWSGILIHPHTPGSGVTRVPSGDAPAP